MKTFQTFMSESDDVINFMNYLKASNNAIKKSIQDKLKIKIASSSQDSSGNDVSLTFQGKEKEQVKVSIDYKKLKMTIDFSYETSPGKWEYKFQEVSFKDYEELAMTDWNKFKFVFKSY